MIELAQAVFMDSCGDSAPVCYLRVVQELW